MDFPQAKSWRTLLSWSLTFWRSSKSLDYCFLHYHFHQGYPCWCQILASRILVIRPVLIHPYYANSYSDQYQQHAPKLDSTWTTQQSSHAYLPSAPPASARHSQTTGHCYHRSNYLHQRAWSSYFQADSSSWNSSCLLCSCFFVCTGCSLSLSLVFHLGSEEWCCGLGNVVFGLATFAGIVLISVDSCWMLFVFFGGSHRGWSWLSWPIAEGVRFERQPMHLWDSGGHCCTESFSRLRPNQGLLLAWNYFWACHNRAQTFECAQCCQASKSSYHQFCQYDGKYTLKASPNETWLPIIHHPCQYFPYSNCWFRSWSSRNPPEQPCHWASKAAISSCCLWFSLSLANCTRKLDS